MENWWSIDDTKAASDASSGHPWLLTKGAWSERRTKGERRKEKGRCSFTDCLLASCGRASAPGRFRQVALCNLCASQRAAFTCMCCTHPRRLLRIVPRTGAPELIFRVPWLDSWEKQWLANWPVFSSTRFWISEMLFLYSVIQLCLFTSLSSLS